MYVNIYMHKFVFALSRAPCILVAMEASALRDLLSPFVPPEQLDEMLLECVRVHLELLLRWNQRVNLTSVRTPEAMMQRHFGESFFAARQLLPRDSTQSVCDLGSGAGFPGLPIQYWAPAASLTLLEAHGKKATFLREVCRALPQLTGVNVVSTRAEELAGYQAELVTLRAVEHFEEALAAALRLVAPQGRLALLIGEGQRERAISQLPAGTVSSVSLPASQQRILLTWQRAD
jgi:16S rRNA (guanine527-N7)-methyltransferase